MPVQKIDSPLAFKVEGNSLWTRINNEWVRLDHIHTEATQNSSGLISANDKIKLDSLSNYTLPTTSDSALGGIKTGFTQTDTERAVKVNSEGKAYVDIPEVTAPKKQWVVLNEDAYNSKLNDGSLDPEQFYFIQGIDAI